MMNKTKLLLLLPLLMFLVGCNGSSSKEKNLNLVSSNSPIDLLDISANFYKEINYGISKNNSFDIFLPNTKNKTPLVILVHGGGFVGGDKNKAYILLNYLRLYN